MIIIRTTTCRHFLNLLPCLQPSNRYLANHYICSNMVNDEILLFNMNKLYRFIICLYLNETYKNYWLIIPTEKSFSSVVSFLTISYNANKNWNVFMRKGTPAEFALNDYLFSYLPSTVQSLWYLHYIWAFYSDVFAERKSNTSRPWVLKLSILEEFSSFWYILRRWSHRPTMKHSFNKFNQPSYLKCWFRK